MLKIPTACRPNSAQFCLVPIQTSWRHWEEASGRTNTLKDYQHSDVCKNRRTDQDITLYYQDSTPDVLGISAKEVEILAREMMHIVSTESCIGL
jgi:hypothetical protein